MYVIAKSPLMFVIIHIILLCLVYYKNFNLCVTKLYIIKPGKVTSLVVPVAAVGALGYGYMWWKVRNFSFPLYFLVIPLGGGFLSSVHYLY